MEKGFGAISKEKQTQKDDNFIRTVGNILPNDLVDSLLNLGDNHDASKLPGVTPDGKFWQPQKVNHLLLQKM